MTLSTRSVVRLLLASALVGLLGVNLVDLIAKPWRSSRADDLLTRAARAICFEQPEAAGSLLKAAEKLDAKRTAVRRSVIAADQTRVVTDHNYARQYYSACGNTDRVAIIDALDRTYTTPKQALEEALTLSNRGEKVYADQLVTLAEKMDPDYAGVARVRQYLKTE